MVDVDEIFTRKRFPKMSIFDADYVTEKLDRLDVQSGGKKSMKKAQKVVKREQVVISIGIIFIWGTDTEKLFWRKINRRH